MRRPPAFRVVAVAAGALVVARFAAGVGWGVRAAAAILLGYAVLRIATATLIPLRVGEKSHPVVDVVEPGGVPVYSCHECGTQLVLLRKGSDRPPRHCGEAMKLRVVPEQPGEAAVADLPPDLPLDLPPDDPRA